MKNNLPPLVSDIKNGRVTWQRIENLDHEVLGYFLSCHLVIEHYMQEYIRTRWPDAGWESANLRFAQKAAILESFKVSDQYDCMPAIRHMNSVRNKLSHNIEFKITEKELLPLRQYLEKAYEGKMPVPVGVIELMNAFTTMTCILFAAGIAKFAEHKGIHRE